ncbi:MAG: AmmeMemoRadiSam system protein B [Deltaproteobacteria bacterium]|nr:AmmeMemoRadiSam system protein B [Deltaproteobacteria bacterium]
MKRTPAVAGTFYPADPESLEKLVRELTVHDREPIRAVGAISPHAGYLYSGGVAGMVFSSIAVPETVVVIGPNHTGYGRRGGILSSGTFGMPGFDVAIDRELAGAIMENTELLKEDADSHTHEHSLEVQLPFIHHHNPSAMIVPICVMGRGIDFVSSIGSAVARAIQDTGRDALVIASSDMTHYEPQEIAQRKDNIAIGRVLELDAAGLLRVTAENDISMCGVIPAAIMLVCAVELGANRARLIDYRTSGQVTHDYDEVVGYAGIAVYRGT